MVMYQVRTLLHNLIFEAAEISPDRRVHSVLQCHQSSVEGFLYLLRPHPFGILSFIGEILKLIVSIFLMRHTSLRDLHNFHHYYI